MSSNQDRIISLERLINQLNGKIVEYNLENKYLKLVEKTRRANYTYLEISDESWQQMLPNEKKKMILHYYLLKRLEYNNLIEKKKKMTIKNKLNEWMESPYVKFSGYIMTTSAFIYMLLEIIKDGLFMGRPTDSKRREIKNSEIADNLLKEFKSENDLEI